MPRTTQSRVLLLTNFQRCTDCWEQNPVLPFIRGLPRPELDVKLPVPNEVAQEAHRLDRAELAPEAHALPAAERDEVVDGRRVRRLPPLRAEHGRLGEAARVPARPYGVDDELGACAQERVVPVRRQVRRDERDVFAGDT